MKNIKKILSMMLICLICFSTMQVGASDSSLYDRMLEAYHAGEQMEDWVVEGRKQIAKELGVSEYLDERSFLSVEYRNENNIGRYEAITDERLNLLVEMATDEEVEAILEKSMLQTLGVDARAITSGQTVSVTQMARVSGAGNGYFTISGGSSYGYCAENSKSFWGNNQAKSGAATEWNNAAVRKVLYYAPGGPGYTGPYYGSLGADMDYATYAIGKLNGDCANNTKATAFINYVSSKADPLASGYKAYKVNITPDTYQDVAFLAYAPVSGYLKAVKTSARPEITSGNSCYSLAGAIYGVYSNAACTTQVGTLTFDASGNSNTLTLAVGTYYLKEKTAPKGYALSTAVTTVTVSSGKTTTASVTDLPQMDPVVILLGKVDKETNQNKPYGSLSLAGAQYTVKYYAGYYDTDPALQGKTPVRIWVLETDEDGFCYLSNEWKVSGDEFFYEPNGYATLPLGTITIQETKAPEGYLINNEVYIRQITSEGTADRVDTYNYPTIPEETLNLNVTKKQEGTDMVIPGVRFEHTSPDGTTEVLTTDENGRLSFKGLTYGTHTVKEISAPDGFTVNGNEIMFTVAEDNTITLTSTIDATKGSAEFAVTEEGHASLTVYDDLAPYSIIVHKQNEDGVKLSGAEFALYTDAGCTQEVTRGTTDTNGILKFAGLEVGTKYYLKEEKAPAGYRVQVDADGDPVVTEIYVESYPVEDEFFFYVDGNEYDASSEGAFTLTGTKEAREVNVTVVNETGYQLPETGSKMMLPMLLSGMALLVFGISKKEEDV